jgi:allantoate deiminase
MRIIGARFGMGFAHPTVENEIDIDRIERRLDAIWDIGKTERGGVTRLAYSEKENAAIDYLLNELSAEFFVETDTIGNVFAATDPDAGTTFYLGSHLDTVFNGGRLDGVLGVVCALEAIEAVLAVDENPPIPPTLTIFRGEESSRFGQHTIGSRGALGMLTVEDLSAVDQSNIPLWQAMQQAGFHPQNLSEPTIDIENIAAFLELHIEQGRVLDESSDAIGIVSGIRAPVRYQATVIGADDHSGATPMGLRRDAITAAAEMIITIEQVATEAASDGDLVATVGDVTVPDGAINKVCGEVRFPIDIRSNNIDYRDKIEKKIIEELHAVENRRKSKLDLELLNRSDPVELDSDMLELLNNTVDAMDVNYRCLPSGGGHDAMNFQHIGIPTGMVFVPSIEGISHSPHEETDQESVEQATALLAHAILHGSP